MYRVFTTTAGQTTFNLGAIAGTNDITLASLDGILLTPLTGFTATLGTFTLLAAPYAGQTLLVVFNPTGFIPPTGAPTTITSGKAIDDVINEARATISDSTQPYRFPTSLLVSFMNTGILEVYRYRPDLFFGVLQTTGVLSDSSEPLYSYSTADLGLSPATALPFDPRLAFDALVFYVIGRTELSDDEFTDDGRAMTLMQNFRTMITGRTAQT